MPAANRIRARISVGQAVPTLHRLDGDPVADCELAYRERRSQRRIIAQRELFVARYRYAKRSEMSLELRNVLYARHAKDWLGTHAVFRRSGNPNTAAMPSSATKTRTTNLRR